MQGDEPLIEPALIRAAAQQLADHADAAIATLCCPIDAADQFANPNIVKVVLDKMGYALYFSRAPIPYARDAFAQGIKKIPAGLPVYRHLGIYAYRAAFLASYAQLAPAPLEQFEALEQLRVLWHGHRISVAIAPSRRNEPRARAAKLSPTSSRPTTPSAARTSHGSSGSKASETAEVGFIAAASA